MFTIAQFSELSYVKATMSEGGRCLVEVYFATQPDEAAIEAIKSAGLIKGNGGFWVMQTTSRPMEQFAPVFQIPGLVYYTQADPEGQQKAVELGFVGQFAMVSPNAGANRQAALFSQPIPKLTYPTMKDPDFAPYWEAKNTINN